VAVARSIARQRQGETLAPGLFAARAKVSPVPREPTEPCARPRSLDDSAARVEPAWLLPFSTNVRRYRWWVQGRPTSWPASTDYL